MGTPLRSANRASLAARLRSCGRPLVFLSVATLFGCGSSAKLTLHQPFAPPSQQRLALASPWGYFAEDAGTIRALLEFPLPAESDGPPAFFCYFVGPAEPGKWRVTAPGRDPEYTLDGGFFPGVVGQPLELPPPQAQPENAEAPPADQNAASDAEEPTTDADEEQADDEFGEPVAADDDQAGQPHEPALDAYRGFLIQAVGRLAGRTNFTVGTLTLRRPLAGQRYREIVFDLYTEDGARLTGRAVLELLPKRFERFEQDFAADVERLTAFRNGIADNEPPPP